jgi:carbon monoxide dehydrogenase subunit G
MASVTKAVRLDAPIAAVWDALRDIGALHTRLVPGFVVDTQVEPDGTARMVTFGNGVVVRERILGVDDEEHRVAWTADSEHFAHHNASAQAIATGPATTKFVWIADVLPDEAGPFVAAMMDEGLAAARNQFAKAAVSGR